MICCGWAGEGFIVIFYSIVIIAFVTCVVWFVRTPTFRHYRRGHGKDPGQLGVHNSSALFNDRHGFEKND